MLWSYFTTGSLAVLLDLVVNATFINSSTLSGMSTKGFEIISEDFGIGEVKLIEGKSTPITPVDDSSARGMSWSRDKPLISPWLREWPILGSLIVASSSVACLEVLVFCSLMIAFSCLHLSSSSFLLISSSSFSVSSFAYLFLYLSLLLTSSSCCLLSSFFLFLSASSTTCLSFSSSFLFSPSFFFSSSFLFLSSAFFLFSTSFLSLSSCVFLSISFFLSSSSIFPLLSFSLHLVSYWFL